MKSAEKRTSHLIANFKDGIAEGWHFKVKECFKTELDIRLTPRTEKKIVSLDWTQGQYFCFSEGQTFYDINHISNTWKDELINIKQACQVVEAEPNSPLKVYDSVSKRSNYLLKEGYVRFLIYKPNYNNTYLTPEIGYNLTQYDFVSFLKTGNIPAKAITHNE